MKDTSKSIVDVDNQQVFTGRYIWEQMMAQSCEIDSANTIVKCALALSIISMLVMLFVWLNT